MKIPKPSIKLGKVGAKFRRDVLKEIVFEDSHDYRRLDLAAHCLDRIEECRVIIEVEGAFIEDRFSQKREHPAIKTERDQKIVFCRIIRELNLYSAGQRVKGAGVVLGGNMPRKRVKPKNRLEPVVAWKITALVTGEMPESKGADAAKKFMWRHPNKKMMREDWLKYKKMILSDYIAKYPGQRPWGWWCFETSEPRQRVGGNGAVIRKKYPAILERFSFGVPVSWYEIDEADPPLFESQSAYLKRHGLLSTSEKKRLSNKDFEPETCLKYVKTYE